jgi:L-lysine 6-transaminase
MYSREYAAFVATFRRLAVPASFRYLFFIAGGALADRHEALLIFDEVQTGLGATGTMWAFEQLGAVPDLLVFGKKTQVCGIMSTARIDSAEKNVFHLSSRINSTWGGSLVDMVRCARALQIMEAEGLVENAARTGRLFLEGLRELERRVPAVTNARGRGLMRACDLPVKEQRNAARQRFWDAGLATLACGQRGIRFRPPLVFGAAEVERALAILRGVLG